MLYFNKGLRQLNGTFILAEINLNILYFDCAI